MFTLKSDFITVFKTGDNINYNLKILKKLYECKALSSIGERHLFNKSIILILISIIEAVLYDFHWRIIKLGDGEVPSLGKNILSYIRGLKKIDQFQICISSAKKHNLFESNSNFYDQLNELRKIRNRIHIQNAADELEKDEQAVFTEQRKIFAERALEKIIKRMLLKYSRFRTRVDFVEDFELPWNEHYKTLTRPLVSLPPTTSYEEYFGYSEEELRLLGFL